jgi:hypothetical protein
MHRFMEIKSERPKEREGEKLLKMFLAAFAAPKSPARCAGHHLVYRARAEGDTGTSAAGRGTRPYVPTGDPAIRKMTVPILWL